MKVTNEAGVLAQSERFFATPSSVARHLLYYVTRCGHYYLDERYDFRDSCEIGKLESHKNFYLIFIRSGAMHFTTSSGKFTASRGQIGFVDCRMPHRFYCTSPTETLWIHFDGANSRDFFEQIILSKGGRHAFTPEGAARIEREMTSIISKLKSSDAIPETQYSQQIYTILCNLLFPPPATPTQNTPVAQALEYIHAHLFEEMPVEEIASAVNLSASHLSRQFRSQTGFSPHEYIVLHRIDEAKALLHNSGLSVKEIAFRVGYRSEVNFIASFTSKVGVSPATFRKNRI